MAASPQELSAGIAPGSLPYGSRKTLEEGLPSAVQQQGPAPGEGGAPDVSGGLPPVDASNPISALVGGEVDPGTGGPATSGLSVGPGPGPGGQTPQIDPVQARLQQIAMQAKSPLIRQMARNELRRLVGERA